MISCGHLSEDELLEKMTKQI